MTWDEYQLWLEANGGQALAPLPPGWRLPEAVGSFFPTDPAAWGPWGNKAVDPNLMTANLAAIPELMRREQQGVGAPGVSPDLRDAVGIARGGIGRQSAVPSAERIYAFQRQTLPVGPPVGGPPPPAYGPTPPTTGPPSPVISAPRPGPSVGEGAPPAYSGQPGAAPNNWEPPSVSTQIQADTARYLADLNDKLQRLFLAQKQAENEGNWALARHLEELRNATANRQIDASQAIANAQLAQNGQLAQAQMQLQRDTLGTQADLTREGYGLQRYGIDTNAELARQRNTLDERLGLGQLQLGQQQVGTQRDLGFAGLDLGRYTADQQARLGELGLGAQERGGYNQMLAALYGTDVGRELGYLGADQAVRLGLTNAYTQRYGVDAGERAALGGNLTSAYRTYADLASAYDPAAIEAYANGLPVDLAQSAAYRAGAPQSTLAQLAANRTGTVNGDASRADIFRLLMQLAPPPSAGAGYAPDYQSGYAIPVASRPTLLAPQAGAAPPPPQWSGYQGSTGGAYTAGAPALIGGPGQGAAPGTLEPPAPDEGRIGTHLPPQRAPATNPYAGPSGSPAAPGAGQVLGPVSGTGSMYGQRAATPEGTVRAATAPAPPSLAAIMAPPTPEVRPTPVLEPAGTYAIQGVEGERPLQSTSMWASVGLPPGGSAVAVPGPQGAAPTAATGRPLRVPASPGTAAGAASYQRLGNGQAILPSVARSLRGEAPGTGLAPLSISAQDWSQKSQGEKDAWAAFYRKAGGNLQDAFDREARQANAFSARPSGRVRTA